MFNSETLEVAIGMVFLFLLMSLVCTAIKEWIEGLLKWRAMDLERAMRTLLDDDTGETSRLLYHHPIIFSLFQGVYQVDKLRKSGFNMWSGADKHMPLSARRNLPSYIPTGHFATALIDQIARRPPPKNTPTAAAPEAGKPGKLAKLDIDLLRQGALGYSAHLRDIILSAIDYADGDLARVRKAIEQWFDGAMDRASGWYKRRTQALLFIIGVVAAVVLNVDSLHILHRLTTDKTLRESVVHRSEAARAPAPAVAASAAVPTIDLTALKETRAELEAVALPIGWEHDDRDAWYSVAPTQFCAASTVDNDQVTRRCDAGHSPFYSWLRIGLGWLVTAMAIMLGAPFWFDVLNKIMIIRSTVKPHEKSPEEPSQDGGTPPASAPSPAPQPDAAAT
ncbi:hypothetical protein [Scleromatobacter humisilvae]|uniref:Uncharacterized protein n=1 Tax=Scleromatobacter humisilvae TaxID=2897159 RepID=A0A9X1YKF4_9BURK|nr:hypothetical protein [Scleromatobacter humisilvae]MCK9687566.1 hypothetical protein [Scleromatobacter humisilvae]